MVCSMYVVCSHGNTRGCNVIPLFPSHPHVLGLCGVCLDTEDSIPVIVLPFMANGDLRTYLRSLRQDYTVDEFPEVSV